MEDQRVEAEVGRGLNIAHLNVRSIMGGHRFEMLRSQIENSNIDVFTISESWLSAAVPDRVIECMNYNVIRLDRSWNDAGDDMSHPKRGGGLVSFVKSNMKYSDTKYEELNVSCKDVEMMWIALDITNVRPIVIVTIYRPPQGDSKRCTTFINEACERANLKDNTDIFLLGDFNIDFNDKKSPKTKELDFMAKSLGLSQLVKSSTRTALTNNALSETKIDLIFSNSDYIIESRTLDYNISDHLAVLVNMKKKATVKEKTEFTGRSYRNYLREDFQNSLTRVDWAPFYEKTEPNELWDFMEAEMLRQANEMCPIRICRVEARREPWLTNEAIEAIRDKDRLME